MVSRNNVHVLAFVMVATLSVCTAIFLSMVYMAGDATADTGCTPMAPPDSVSVVPLADINVLPPGYRGESKERRRDEIKVVELPRDLPQPEAQLIPLVFCWPNQEWFSQADKEDATCHTKEMEWSEKTALWASKVLSLPDKRPPRLKLYEANRAVYYWLPDKGPTKVRLVYKPLDKTNHFPVEVQCLTEGSYSQDKIREMFKSLPEWVPQGPLAKSNLPLLSQVVATAPISDKFKNASWHLKSFTFQFDWRIATVNFESEVDKLPFRLQVTIGPRGSLLVLSGIGLRWLLDEDAAKKLAPPTPPGVSIPGMKIAPPLGIPSESPEKTTPTPEDIP